MLCQLGHLCLHSSSHILALMLPPCQFVNSHSFCGWSWAPWNTGPGNSHRRQPVFPTVFPSSFQVSQFACVDSLAPLLLLLRRPHHYFLIDALRPPHGLNCPTQHSRLQRVFLQQHPMVAITSFSGRPLNSWFCWQWALPKGQGKMSAISLEGEHWSPVEYVCWKAAIGL